jgi:hypothetical protein
MRTPVTAYATDGDARRLNSPFTVVSSASHSDDFRVQNSSEIFPPQMVLVRSVDFRLNGSLTLVCRATDASRSRSRSA